MPSQGLVGPGRPVDGRISTGGSGGGHCIRKLRSTQRRPQVIAVGSSNAEQD
jgi:hypothetical protein